jgi:hypothetical protein
MWCEFFSAAKLSKLRVAQRLSEAFREFCGFERVETKRRDKMKRFSSVPAKTKLTTTNNLLKQISYLFLVAKVRPFQ